MSNEITLAGPTPGAGSRRVRYLAITGDFAVAIAKFIVAALTGSSAMLTEGVHSLVDIDNELLLLYGVRRGQRTVDERHPFDYGKTNCVWSLIVRHGRGARCVRLSNQC